MTNVLGSFEATDEERYALQLAADHSCNCPAEGDVRICGAHQLLANEGVIKHMLFVRRMFVGEMMAGEFK